MREKGGGEKKVGGKEKKGGGGGDPRTQDKNLSRFPPQIGKGLEWD